MMTIAKVSVYFLVMFMALFLAFYILGRGRQSSFYKFAVAAILPVSLFQIAKILLGGDSDSSVLLFVSSIAVFGLPFGLHLILRLLPDDIDGLWWTINNHSLPYFYIGTFLLVVAGALNRDSKLYPLLAPWIFGAGILSVYNLIYTYIREPNRQPMFLKLALASCMVHIGGTLQALNLTPETSWLPGAGTPYLGEIPLIIGLILLTHGIGAEEFAPNCTRKLTKPSSANEIIFTAITYALMALVFHLNESKVFILLIPFAMWLYSDRCSNERISMFSLRNLIQSCFTSIQSMLMPQTCNKRVGIEQTHPDKNIPLSQTQNEQVSAEQACQLPNQLISQNKEETNPISEGQGENYPEVFERPSERQLEVLKLAGQGLTNHQIGNELSISINTVKSHLRVIYEMWNVKSRIEAINIGRTLNLL